MAQTPVPQDSHAGCFVHLFWMFGGGAILLLCVFYVFDHSVRGLTLIDLGYWLTVIAMVAARWVDIRTFHGDTATGEPATLSHWRKYSVNLVIVALAVWIIIHLLTLTGIISSVSVPAGTIP